MRFKLFAIVLILLFAAGTALAYEHPRYKIDAEIDTHAKTITARQSVLYTNNTSRPLNEIYFHIYPNRFYTEKEKRFMLLYAGYFKVIPFPEGFPKGGLNIRSARRGAETASYVIEGSDQTLLKVSLDEPLAAGASTEIALDFDLEIPHSYGRLGWHKSITALARWYPIVSVADDRGWNNHPFYPFHRPFFSDAAYYDVTVTVPAKETVIHTGDLQSEEVLDGKKRLVISTSQPVREFTLAMSPDYQILKEDAGGVTVKSYYLPGQEVHGGMALRNAIDLMAYYSDKLGPYPYKTFSIAPVYLGYGGEQMSNLVFIDTRVYDLPKFLNRYFDFLIAHETGHQWFYNVIGSDDYNEMWLEEGVNSYFLLLHLENKYGKEADVIAYRRLPMLADMVLPDISFRRARDARYKMQTRFGLERPIISDLSSFHEPSSIFSITYGKGSMVVDMLRHQVGDETFARIFKRIYDEFKFRNLSVIEFIRICEEEHGEDLSWFFDPWLFTTDRFDAGVAAVKGNRLTLKNRQKIKMPVEVKVEYVDGKTEEFVWQSTELETVTLKHTAKVRRVKLDPDQKLLDIDRPDNTWPRELALHPVPLYLPLYDVPIFMPDESYNLVFGPEISDGVGVKASLQKPYDQNFYVGTDYELGEEQHTSRVGYQLNNVLNTQTAFGFEIKNRNDFDDDEEDLASGKVYLRRELWPVQYGLTSINDHITLYVVRNRSLDSSLIVAGTEDFRNVSYRKHDESIVGMNLHIGRAIPYPDPSQGYTLDTFVEHSGHFWGATQYFYRAGFDTGWYYPLTRRSKLALRLKYGWGTPDDKDLYELGGYNGLRGFDRKTVRGSNSALTSLEYRFPLVDELNLSVLDHLFTLDALSGVVFIDAGQAWYDDFDNSRLYKNAGLGLRMHVNIASFVEKAIVRLDVGMPINESDDDAQVWFGLNQAF